MYTEQLTESSLVARRKQPHDELNRKKIIATASVRATYLREYANAVSKATGETQTTASDDQGE